MHSGEGDPEIRSEELARHALWFVFISIVIVALCALLRQQNALIFAPAAALLALAMSIRAVSYWRMCPRPRAIAPPLALAVAIALVAGYVWSIWRVYWALGHMN
jgi:hypothetical protein